jgi:hypothetical protein
LARGPAGDAWRRCGGYGSVEKDGSSDLDVDWLADGWLALLRR